MGKVKWYIEIGQDSLEIGTSEVEELENDELSIGEAGFMRGYEEEEEAYEEV